MAQDSEKRFHSIMDKLFHAPKSLPNPSSSSGAQLSRGKKRPNPTSALAPVDPKKRWGMVQGSQHSSAAAKSAQAPLCKPWDRGDLMRRLSTFKSMTWFAKPKVVSAVNCAMRGWVNVDTDTIACEACGARLLFSSPSSWTQQQVEKVALVFSLKLDNGHKLLCPWIDNACDEMLAEFPPTPPPVLVDKFGERSSALLRLLALPVISSSAIEYMRSPQLEEFLKRSWTLEYGNGSANISQTESLGNGSDMDSANLYYQAQKLVSLCGWEPRSLPYVVDCKGGANHFVKDAEILNSSHLVANGQNPSISLQSAVTNEIMEANESTGAQNRLQYDPKSVVLDCRLCGASVGLWAFSTVLRPVELFRLIGYTEVNCGSNSGTHDSGHESHIDIGGGVINDASNGALLHKESSSSLNLTIAGGPPPTKQNFKATISLPVIGQSLRAKFSYDYDFRDRMYNNQDIQVVSTNKNLFQEEIDRAEYAISGHIVQPEDINLSQSRGHDKGHCSSTSDDQFPCLSHNISEQGDYTLGKENSIQLSLEGANVTGEGTFPETDTHNSITETPMESTLNVVQGFGQSNRSPENTENVETVNSAVGDFGSSQGDYFITNLNAGVSIGNGENIEHDSSLIITADNCNLQHIPETDIVCSPEISLASQKESLCNASCSDAGVNVDNACNIDPREGIDSSDNQNTSTSQADVQEGDKVGVQIPVNNQVVSCGTEKDPKQLRIDNAMKFDPIRQHRHFCPWIVSTGSSPPGWQQTLSALHRQKELSHPSPTNSPSSASMIKVDDPVASVRKLFMSPPTKRTKPPLTDQAETPGSAE